MRKESKLSVILIFTMALSMCFLSGCGDNLRSKYVTAHELYEQGAYEEAAAAFDEIVALGGYLDSEGLAEISHTEIKKERILKVALEVVALEDKGEYEKAIELAAGSGDYLNASRIIEDFYFKGYEAERASGSYETRRRNIIAAADKFISLSETALELKPDDVDFSSGSYFPSGSPLHQGFDPHTNEGYVIVDTIRIGDYYITKFAEMLGKYDAYESAIDMLKLLPDGITLPDGVKKADMLKTYEMSLKEYEEKTANGDIFDLALAEFENDNYDAAIELFGSIINDAEKGNYARYCVEMIKAYRIYTTGDWVNAAHALTKARSVNYRDTQLNTIIKNKLSLERPSSSYEDVTEYFPAERIDDGLYNDCVNYYYEETYNVSDGLSKIKNSQPEFFPEKANAWFFGRNNALRTKIESKGLEEYYNRTDNSVSPINVTSDKWYVNYRLVRDAYQPVVPPYFIAATPEQVRYVLTYQEEYVFYGTYDNGTKGYSAVTHVTLKDVKTGGILFSETYTIDPPASVSTKFGASSNSVYNDTYADFRIGADVNDMLDKYIPVQ